MSSSRLKIKREQLAKFLPDPESIRAFEALFRDTDETIPSSVESVEVLAGNAESLAIQAIGALSRLADAVERLELAPPDVPDIEHGDLSPPVVFDLGAAAGTLSMATVRWNLRVLDADATASVGDFCDCDTTLTDINVTLPDPTLPANIGRELMVGKNYSGANTMTLIGTVSGVVDPSFTAQYTQAVLVSNGVEWIIK